jgi:hypothetical protein
MGKARELVVDGSDGGERAEIRDGPSDKGGKVRA